MRKKSVRELKHQAALSDLMRECRAQSRCTASGSVATPCCMQRTRHTTDARCRQQNSACAGRRRLLRLLQQLRSRAVPRHAQLLLAICSASPPLASAFLVRAGCMNVSSLTSALSGSQPSYNSVMHDE